MTPSGSLRGLTLKYFKLGHSMQTTPKDEARKLDTERDNKNYHSLIFRLIFFGVKWLVRRDDKASVDGVWAGNQIQKVSCSTLALRPPLYPYHSTLISSSISTFSPFFPRTDFSARFSMIANKSSILIIFQFA